jgi:hypothetical protein
MIFSDYRRTALLESKATLLPTNTYGGNPVESHDNIAEVPLPSNIRDLMDSRLAQLSPEAKNMLSIASVIGRSFEFDTLCAVSQLEEEVCISSLEELLLKGLVQGSAGNREEERSLMILCTINCVAGSMSRSAIHADECSINMAEVLAQRSSTAHQTSLGTDRLSLPRGW